MTASARQRALDDHARFMEENLPRNYRANFIHGVLGMTGFRLIYAPTIIPAYLLMLTGSTAAVGLGAAMLQLGATISPIASGSRIEHRSHILPYAIKVDRGGDRCAKDSDGGHRAFPLTLRRWRAWSVRGPRR